MSTSRVFTVGQVLTAAQMNDLPQGHMADGGSTVDVGPTSGTTELTIVTLNAFNVAGSTRILKATLTARGIDATTGDTYEIRIKDGSTIVGATTYTAPGTNTQELTVIAMIAPVAAGSHTFSATIVRTNGTGTATVRGTASIPIRLFVEDIGQ